jgi:hypothetical protein
VHRLGLVLAEKVGTLYSIAKIRSLLPAMENDELQNYGGTCYFNRNTSAASCASEMRLPLRILTKRAFSTFCSLIFVPLALRSRIKKFLPLRKISQWKREILFLSSEITRSFSPSKEPGSERG